MAYVNPFDQVNKRPTIYDGSGNRTTPYHTQYYQANRRWVQFHAKFYTQNAGYDAYYTIGRRDTTHGGNTESDQLTTPKLEHEFDRELMGFDTSNQGNKSIPTMNIYLFAFRDWEQILQVNDYAALTVWECYPDSKAWLQEQKEDPYSDNGVEKRTLMTGLISNIHVSEDSQSQGKVYVITCQGMQKILADINLGLPKTAEIGSTNLLFDINGESNPANEQYPFGNTGNTSSSKSSGPKGSAKEVGGKNERAFIGWCNNQGLAVNQTAGLAGNAVIEAGGWNGTGNYFGITAPGTQSGEGGESASDVTNYLNWTVLHKGHESYDSLAKCPAGFREYKSDTKSTSAYKCAGWWNTKILGTQDPTGPAKKGAAAESIYKQIK